MRISPGVSSPDQLCASAHEALTNPVVVRKEVTVNMAPQKALPVSSASALASTSKAPRKWRTNSTTGTPRISASPMRNSGSVKSLPCVAVTVSLEKVSRDSANSMNSIIIASAPKPTPVSCVPPSGEMPEVASTDIAWHSATSDRSPLASSSSHSISVSAR